VAAIFILDVAGLISAAILCAALLIPVLYLIYLYEAQVYRDAPAPALGFTIGGGVILGIIVTTLVNHFSNPLDLGGPLGSTTRALIGLCVIVPIVQEVVKPIPALILRESSDFRETVDGLVFGVAAGLGFSVAETIIRFSSVLSSLNTRTDPGNWIYPLLTLAITLPLLQGSATGAITAAIWRMRAGRVGQREVGIIVAALLAHVGFILVSQLLFDRALSQLVILAWQGAVVCVLLIGIRYLLHYALLEEATHMGFVETVCPTCHRHIVASSFCPTCGKALIAAPSSITKSRKPAAATTPAEG
jgi:hypothetical protein